MSTTTISDTTVAAITTIARDATSSLGGVS